MLMGRTFARPERMHMFFKQYLNEMVQLGVNSIGIVLLISFFIGAVITIQIKLNIESPWMPRFVVGYTTREIMLLEFSSSIMCLILSGKVGSNIASEIGTMRVTQQIDALEIMGVNSAGYLILPKIIALMTMIPFFGYFQNILGDYWCLLHLLVRRSHECRGSGFTYCNRTSFYRVTEISRYTGNDESEKDRFNKTAPYKPFLKTILQTIGQILGIHDSSEPTGAKGTNNPRGYSENNQKKESLSSKL
jgi:flagellar biosynthesis protein FliQ